VEVLLHPRNISLKNKNKSDVLSSNALLSTCVISKRVSIVSKSVVSRITSKRAEMAIGTLIIFIAMILISAIVAGFLIGTTGILQQRSAMVAKETESRLTSGVEVLNYYVRANVSAETVNHYTILVRLKAGSDPLNIKYVSLVLNTEDNTYPLNIQDESNAMYGSVEFSEMSNSTELSFLDVDYDGEEEYADLFFKAENVTLDNGTIVLKNMSYILMNFSDYGEFYYYLGDLSNISENNTLEISGNDIPVFTNRSIELSGDGAVKILGFLQFDMLLTKNNTIPGFTMTEYPEKCSFDTIVGIDRFCYDVQIGNDNSVVEKGESFNLLFSLPEDLGPDSPYELQIVPKTGSIQRINGYIPSVLVLRQVVLYP
jgi:archaellin